MAIEITSEDIFTPEKLKAILKSMQGRGWKNALPS